MGFRNVLLNFFSLLNMTFFISFHNLTHLKLFVLGTTKLAYGVVSIKKCRGRYHKNMIKSNRDRTSITDVNTSLQYRHGEGKLFRVNKCHEFLVENISCRTV